MVDTISKQPEEYINWMDLSQQYNLNKKTITITRRTYNLFKLWPKALQHIKKLSPRDIYKLDANQTLSLFLRLVLEVEEANFSEQSQLVLDLFIRLITIIISQSDAITLGSYSYNIASQFV